MTSIIVYNYKIISRLIDIFIINIFVGDKFGCIMEYEKSHWLSYQEWKDKKECDRIRNELKRKVKNSLNTQVKFRIPNTLLASLFLLKEKLGVSTEGKSVGALIVHFLSLGLDNQIKLGRIKEFDDDEAYDYLMFRTEIGFDATYRPVKKGIDIEKERRRNREGQKSIKDKVKKLKKDLSIIKD